MATTRTVRVCVHGRVQGIGFRYTLQDVARREGVVGWCQNQPDGSVEALLSGDPEAIEIVLAWCQVGPALSWVERVEVEPSAEEPPEQFEIRR